MGFLFEPVFFEGACDSDATAQANEKVMADRAARFQFGLPLLSRSVLVFSITHFASPCEPLSTGSCAQQVVLCFILTFCVYLSSFRWSPFDLILF